MLIIWVFAVSLATLGLLLSKLPTKVRFLFFTLGIVGSLAATAWTAIEILFAKRADRPLSAGVRADGDSQWRQGVSWSVGQALTLFFLVNLVLWSLWFLPPVAVGFLSGFRFLPRSITAVWWPRLEAGFSNQGLAAVLMPGILLVLTVWFVRRRHPARYPFGWFQQGSLAEDIRQGCIGCFSAFLVVMFAMAAYHAGVLFLSHLLPVDVPSINAFMEHAKATERSEWDSLPSVVAALLLAPISEEMFFRGVLYRSLRRNWSREASTAVSALSFALMHFQFYFFIPTFVLGMMTCKVYEERRSLTAPIALHGTWNLVAAAVRLLPRFVSQFSRW